MYLFTFELIGKQLTSEPPMYDKVEITVKAKTESSAIELVKTIVEPARYSTNIILLQVVETL
jgi:hypothetical protein